MSKKLLPILIALIFALAGCLGIADDEPEPAGDGDGSNGSQDAGDGDGTNGDNGNNAGGDDDTGNDTPNEAPTASLSANRTQGTANLSVTFDLDGSDPEEGHLTWTLDLGDGNTTEGDELPDMYEHTFTTPGNFSVVFTVSDQENETQDETLIEVQAPEETGPVQVVDGSFLVGNPLQGCVLAAYTVGLDNEATYYSADLDEATHGLPYVAEFSSTVPSLGFLVAFAEGTSLTTAETTGPDPDAASTITGTVPDGAESIMLASCGGAQIDVNVTIG